MPALIIEEVELPAASVSAGAAQETPIELIEATPVGADVIPFRRPTTTPPAVIEPAIDTAPAIAIEPGLAIEPGMATEQATPSEPAVLAEDIPLGLIEAAPVSALEVSPLATFEGPAIDLALNGAPAAEPHVDLAPDHDPLTSPSADATGVVTLANDVVVTADLETPRNEVLALALAATDAPTIEVMALALTVDDPLHLAAAKLSAAHESGIFAATQDSDILGTPRESKLLDPTHESEILRATHELDAIAPATHELPALPSIPEPEITVELCALDLKKVAPAPISIDADLDLSAEISALDLRPVEVALEPLPPAKPVHRKLSRPVPHARDVILDDNTPTVEVKSLALQELEAERAPADAGDDITFTYVPPALSKK
jgi:hypothetical protein